MSTHNGHLVQRRSILAMIAAGVTFGVRVFADAIPHKFRVTLREAHVGDLETDTRLLDSYGLLPENVRQFYFAARRVFVESADADFSDPRIVEAAQHHGLALMGGPMLGDLRQDGASLWLRPATAEPLTVKVATSGGTAARSYQLKSVKPGIEQRIKLDGLSSNTAYHYLVLAKDRSIAEGSFTTAPASDDKGVFRLAFGADMHKIGVHNPNLFREILEREPKVMLLLGDSAVDDRESQINMHRSDYQLRDVSKPWRDFSARVPVYASWDDHDYFNNDLSGIPRSFSGSDRQAVRAVWHQNWNNPPSGDAREGIYFNTRIGPVEVIMLDTRSCRDNKQRSHYGSYLGAEQLSWLKQTLKTSTAPFKVISSGTMWSDYVSKGKDSWGTWDTQAREEIFEMIEQENISGVLLISGDRHGARGFRIPRPSGFDFREFEIGTLGGVPGPAGRVQDCAEQLFGYDGENFIAFGEFTFDTAGKEPQVCFRLIDDSGQILEEHAYSYRQLTPRSK